MSWGALQQDTTGGRLMRANSAVDPAQLLDRPRLRLRLSASDGGPAGFILLNAPAGYGKSTLAKQLLDSLPAHEYRTLWIHTTARTKSSFWRHLRAQLEERPHPTGEPDDESRAHEWVLDHVSLLPASLVLVIDAYHRVSDAQTDLALLELSGASARIHLVVLARSVRLLDGPLFADEVLTVGPEELAFDAEELGTLARRCRTPLHSRLRQSLELTGGWPRAASAVLRAECRDAVASSRPSGAERASASPALHPQLARLAIDSLDLLNDEARAVMLAASVLDTISLEQAAELLESTEDEAILQIQPLLEHGLLSLTGLTHRTVYRAHPAIRAGLADLARRSYSALDHATLLRGSARERASQDPLSALRMYLESSSLADAEAVLAAHFTTLTDRGEECTRLLRPLTDETLREFPTFAAARMLLEFSDRTVSHEHLHRLTRLMQEGASRRLEADLHSAPTLAIAHRVQVMIGERLGGNMPSALAIARDLEPLIMSRAHSPEEVPGQDHRDSPGTQPVFLEELGFTAFMGGDRALARRVWQRLDHQMQVSSSDLVPPTVGVTSRHAAWRLAALYGLALVEADDGDFIVAAEIIAQADALQEESGVSAPSLSWINGEVARAHLSYESLDADMLAQAMARVAPWNDRFEQWPMILMADVEATRYLRGPDWAIPHLRAGISQIERARHGVGVWGGYLALYQAMLNTTLGDFTISGRILRSLPAENLFVQIERARLSLFSGDNVRALLEVQQIGLAGISKRQRIDKFLMAAIAAWGCGLRDEAIESLNHAGELVERNGLSMMFRTVPFEPLRAIAVAARAAGAYDLVERIDRVPIQARGVVRERLTTMEQRALETMVTHPSLAAAAEHVSIAPATMKRHRLAVYRKLQVGGREEAILQATRMGLLVQQRPAAAEPNPH